MEWLTELKIKKLCLYDEKIYEKCCDYFDVIKTQEGIKWLVKQINDTFHNFKYYGETFNHISKNGLKLAIKIYKQTGVFCFPNIQRVARKGWSTSIGTWAWSMNSFEKGNIGSTDPVKDCIKKVNNLAFGNKIGHYDLSNEISIS